MDLHTHKRTFNHPLPCLGTGQVDRLKTGPVRLLMIQVGNSEVSRFLFFFFPHGDASTGMFQGKCGNTVTLVTVMSNIFFQETTCIYLSSSFCRLSSSIFLFGRRCWKFCLHLPSASALLLERLTSYFLVLERLTLK